MKNSQKEPGFFDQAVPADLAANIQWYKTKTLQQGPKSFIICCDGTANQIFPDEGRNSNVSRVARCVSGIKSPSGKEQVVAYQGGLGTDIGPLNIDNFSSVLGTGLDMNICLAYEWLCEVYEPGSDIVLCGYSRAAFAAKVLACFICDIGLLTPLRDRKTFRHAILEAYHVWSKNKRRRGSVVSTTTRDSPVAYRPDVTALALWDPVRALGVSTQMGDSTDILNEKLDFIQFELPDKVEHVFQVFATNEHRDIYQPSLFRRTSRDRQVLKQVWFPGSHVAVGGGSPHDLDRIISLRTMAWMLASLEKYKIMSVDERRLRQLVSALAPSRLDHPQPLFDPYNFFYKSVARTPGKYFSSVDYRETRETCRWNDLQNGRYLVSRSTRYVVDTSPNLPEEPRLPLEDEIDSWLNCPTPANTPIISIAPFGETVDFEGSIIDAAPSAVITEKATLSRQSTDPPPAPPPIPRSRSESRITRKPSRLDRGRALPYPVSDPTFLVRRQSLTPAQPPPIVENKKIENIEIRNIKETFVDRVIVNDNSHNSVSVNESQSNWSQDNSRYSNRTENDTWIDAQSVNLSDATRDTSSGDFSEITYDQYTDQPASQLDGEWAPNDMYPQDNHHNSW